MPVYNLEKYINEENDMAVTNRITMLPFPDADTALEYYNSSEKFFDLEPPEGYGWRLENSFIGNNVIYFHWKKGSMLFDGGLNHYWTGYGDNLTTSTYGDGNRMVINNTTGIISSYVDVEFIHTDTYMYGGTVTVDNSDFGNEITMEYYAKETTLETSTSGTVIIDNGKVLPSDNGTHNIVDFGLVPDDNGDWDYDENGLVASVNGKFSLYTFNVLLVRPVNGLPITGLNGTEQSIISNNVIDLLYGSFLRIKTKNNTDTNWNAYIYVHLLRKNTI